MKIAVLADIHGNMQALDAVIGDARRLGISDFIIAGDNITDGPESSEVIKRIRELSSWVIKGNREDYIIKYHTGAFAGDWNTYKQVAALVCTYERLDAGDIEYVVNLPEQLTIELPEMPSIKVVHGSPFSMYESLYCDQDLDLLEKAVLSIDEEVLICGHTHQQWTKQINGKLIVNPGSLGGHFGEEICAPYAVLSFNEDVLLFDEGKRKGKGEWEVELKQIKYDFELYEKKIHDTGLLDGSPVWTSLMLESTKKGQNFCVEFLEFAYKMTEEAGYENGGLIPNEIWDKAEEEWAKSHH